MTCDRHLVQGVGQGPLLVPHQACDGGPYGFLGRQSLLQGGRPECRVQRYGRGGADERFHERLAGPQMQVTKKRKSRDQETTMATEGRFDRAGDHGGGLRGRPHAFGHSGFAHGNWQYISKRRGRNMEEHKRTIRAKRPTEHCRRSASTPPPAESSPGRAGQRPQAQGRQQHHRSQLLSASPISATLAGTAEAVLSPCRRNGTPGVRAKLAHGRTASRPDPKRLQPGKLNPNRARSSLRAGHGTVQHIAARVVKESLQRGSGRCGPRCL